MANAHATLKMTKFFLNKPQEDKSIDDRLEAFLTVGSEWFEDRVRFVAGSTPIAVTTRSTQIASRKAAGEWELANQQDRAKTPVNLKQAELEIQEFINEYDSDNVNAGILEKSQGIQDSFLS